MTYFLGPRTFTDDVLELCDCYIECKTTRWGDYIEKEDVEAFLLQHPLLVEASRVFGEIRADYEATKRHFTSTVSARTWEQIEAWEVSSIGRQEVKE